MASGFFALFDDIASLLDDVATTTKVAGKQTAAILGDDLAVNAQKASGFSADRELRVLWAITKGSLLNKAILLPIGFLLAAFAPWAIVPILLLGGLYLAYEGVEKVAEHFGWIGHESSQEEMQDEAQKIRSAVRTDFILSIEIIVIALGSVASESLLVQIAVVSLIALAATVGVYGLVALIVRLDDMGYALIRFDLKDKEEEWLSKVGRFLVALLPKIVRALGYIGTVAMLLVAGGIWTHHVEALHHHLKGWPPLTAEALVGLVLGALVVLVVQMIRIIFYKN